MSGPRHIGPHEVEKSVVVYVCYIRAHRKPRNIGQDFAGNLIKATVTLVSVKSIGTEEVVCNIQVREAVLVIIEPRCGQALVGADKTCSFAHVNKTTSVVAEKVIVLTSLHNPKAFSRMKDDVIQFPVFLLNYCFTIFNSSLNSQTIRRRFQMSVAIRDQVTIQVTIQIVVGKGHFDICSLVSETQILCSIHKASPCPILEHQVYVSCTGNKYVQIAVAIMIHKAATDSPVFCNCLTQTDMVSNVTELELSQVFEKPMSPIRICKKEIRKIITIKISGTNSDDQGFV